MELLDDLQNLQNTLSEIGKVGETYSQNIEYLGNGMLLHDEKDKKQKEFAEKANKEICEILRKSKINPVSAILQPIHSMNQKNIIIEEKPWKRYEFTLVSPAFQIGNCFTDIGLSHIWIPLLKYNENLDDKIKKRDLFIDFVDNRLPGNFYSRSYTRREIHMKPKYSHTVVNGPLETEFIDNPLYVFNFFKGKLWPFKWEKIASASQFCILNISKLKSDSNLEKIVFQKQRNYTDDKKITDFFNDYYIFSNKPTTFCEVDHLITPYCDSSVPFQSNYGLNMGLKSVTSYLKGPGSNDFLRTLDEKIGLLKYMK